MLPLIVLTHRRIQTGTTTLQSASMNSPAVTTPSLVNMPLVTVSPLTLMKSHHTARSTFHGFWPELIDGSATKISSFMLTAKKSSLNI